MFTVGQVLLLCGLWSSGDPRILTIDRALRHSWFFCVLPPRGGQDLRCTGLDIVYATLTPPHSVLGSSGLSPFCC